MLLTIREASRLIGRTPATVRRYIRSGRLQAGKEIGKFGEEYKIRREDLQALGFPTDGELPVRVPHQVPAARDTAPQEMMVPASLYHAPPGEAQETGGRGRARGDGGQLRQEPRGHSPEGARDRADRGRGPQGGTAIRSCPRVASEAVHGNGRRGQRPLTEGLAQSRSGLRRRARGRTGLCPRRGSRWAV